MKKQTHSLTDRDINDINENGLKYEYAEFNDSKFDNEFIELENQDYKIHASQKDINKTHKEDNMKNTRKKGSYVSQLTSGYDAKVQNDYDSNSSKSGQIGKDHEEEVAPKNNWTDDKRDAIGRAASVTMLRRTAARISKMADAIESNADDEELDLLEEENFEDEVLDDELEDDELEDDVEGEEDFEEMIEEVASSLNTKEASTKKEATHPNERPDDSPKSEMPSDTGDEWIDIGPGEFDDKRDDIGRAGSNE